MEVEESYYNRHWPKIVLLLMHSQTEAQWQYTLKDSRWIYLDQWGWLLTIHLYYGATKLEYTCYGKSDQFLLNFVS